MAGYLAGVYLLVVVAGRAALPQAPALQVLLTYLAAVLVALTLAPLWAALSRRLPPTAEERLDRLASRHLEWDEVGDALEQLCRLVTEALRAHSTEVVVQLDAGVTLRRAFPAEGPDGVGGHLVGSRSTRGWAVVRHPLRRGPRELGELVVTLTDDRPLPPVEGRLLVDAADHAALVVEVTRMDRSLQQVVAGGRRRYEELRHSRARISAVMEEERHRVERDIHDGAQQHLVALAVNLRLLRVLLERDPARAAARTPAMEQVCVEAIQTLDRLSRGLYPPQLAERGPVAALATASASSPIPVTVVAPDPGQRWTPEVERAMYFSGVEALQNAVKHGQASRIVVTVAPGPHEVSVTVSDDGRGFDLGSQPEGSGTANMRDRLESVGGTLTVGTIPGRGTSLTGRIPLDAPLVSPLGPG